MLMFVTDGEDSMQGEAANVCSTKQSPAVIDNENTNDSTTSTTNEVKSLIPKEEWTRELPSDIREAYIQGREVFKCGVCTFKATARDTLMEHVADKHKIGEQIY